MLNIFLCSLPRRELWLFLDTSGTADFFFFYPVFQWFTGPWLGRRMSAVWFKIRLEEGIRFKEAGGKIWASLRLVGEWPLNLSGFLISLDLFSSIFILIKFSISRNCPFFFFFSHSASFQLEAWERKYIELLTAEWEFLTHGLLKNNPLRCCKRF